MNDSATRTMAASATLHCLIGCAIGEILGLIIGAHYGLSNLTTTILAIVLSFLSGYGLSLLPLVRHGMPLAQAARLVLAADTLSIATMELVDNLIMWLIPGAMDAHYFDMFFWVSMAFALGIAFLAAWPVNYLLLRRGKGHALTHYHIHGQDHESMSHEHHHHGH